MKWILVSGSLALVQSLFQVSCLFQQQVPPRTELDQNMVLPPPGTDRALQTRKREAEATVAFTKSISIKRQNNDANGDRYAETTLQGQRILVAITSFGMGQFVYLEIMLDSFRDLCEAGAFTDVHVYTDAPYGVDTIDQLSTRLRCRNPNARYTVTVHLKSPDWKFRFIDFHRPLFYENIDKYDLFVQTEDDHLIRPSHCIAWLQEEQKLKDLVGPERFVDYAIGFIRFEIKTDDKGKRRTSIEQKFKKDKIDLVHHPGLEGHYWITPRVMGFNQQGLFMVTPELLRAWEHRKPFCKFSAFPQRFHQGLHREMVGGGGYIFNKRFCNITQLLPLDATEDFYIWHLSNKYAGKSVQQPKVHSLLRLHRTISKEIPEAVIRNRTFSLEHFQMYNDETDSKKQASYNPDMSEYKAYVDRGRILFPKG